MIDLKYSNHFLRYLEVLFFRGTMREVLTYYYIKYDDQIRIRQLLVIQNTFKNVSATRLKTVPYLYRVRLASLGFIFCQRGLITAMS